MTPNSPIAAARPAAPSASARPAFRVPPAVLALAAAAVLMWSAPAAQAVEADEGNPGVFRLLMETERVRILEASTRPGEAEGWHSHPSYFAYVVQGGKLRMESPDGSSREVSIESGQSILLEPVERHQGVNIGETTIRILLVEYKDPAIAQ